ncbi:tetratricopeptide repeat protein [Anthocerotibacter panamensis]|uniref:tetratricopeptide repeat protein n=1 Tax=Anthocerotibacter panamensis TaxID=2857077 RepID=UPI001C403D27|nr:tetratricopeptide repeat protein [Anthocerotibacter panamensis]
MIADGRFSFIHDLYRRAVDRAVLGDHQGAVADWTQLLALDPRAADAYYSRGISYASLGEHRRAIQDFVAYLQSRPDNLYAVEAMQHILAFNQAELLPSS